MPAVTHPKPTREERQEQRDAIKAKCELTDENVDKKLQSMILKLLAQAERLEKKGDAISIDKAIALQAFLADLTQHFGEDITDKMAEKAKQMYPDSKEYGTLEPARLARAQYTRKQFHIDHLKTTTEKASDHLQDILKVHTNTKYPMFNPDKSKSYRAFLTFHNNVKALPALEVRQPEPIMTRAL